MSKDFEELLNTLIDQQIKAAGRQTEWFDMDTNARADYIKQVNERLQEMQQSTLSVLAAQHFQMQENPVSIEDHLQTLERSRQELDKRPNTPAREAYKLQLERDIQIYRKQQSAITHFDNSRKKALNILSDGLTLDAETLRKNAADKQTQLDTEITSQEQFLKQLLEQQLTIQEKADPKLNSKDVKHILEKLSSKYVKHFSNLQAYKYVKTRYNDFLKATPTEEVEALNKLTKVPQTSDNLPVNISLLMMEERPGYIRMSVALVDTSPDGRFKDFFMRDGRLVVPEGRVFNFSFGTPARSLAWQQQYRLKYEPSLRSPTYAPIRSVLVKIKFVEKFFANYLVSENSEREGLKEHFLDNDRKILLSNVDRKVPNQIGIKVSSRSDKVPLASTLSDLINQNADITSFRTTSLEDFRNNSYNPDRDGLFTNIHELERSVGFADRQYLLEMPQGETYLSATPFLKISVEGDKIDSKHLTQTQTAELYQYNAAFFEKLDLLRDNGAEASHLFEDSAERNVFEQQLVRLLERNHITPAAVLESKNFNAKTRDIKGNNLNKVLWEKEFATSVWENIENDPLLFKLAKKLNSLVFSSKIVDKILENNYVQSDIAQSKELLAQQYEQWRIQAIEEETQRINQQHPNNLKKQDFNHTEVERSVNKKLLALLLVGPESFDSNEVQQDLTAEKSREALLSNKGRSLRKQALFHVLRPVADSYSKRAVPINPHAELMPENGENKVIINNRLNQPDPYLLLNTRPEERVYHDGSYLIKDDKYRSYNQFRPDPENKATRYMNDLDTPFVGGISGTTQTVSNVLPELFGGALTTKEYWQFQMVNAAFMIRNGYHSFFETFYVAARYEPKSADSIGQGMLQMFDKYRAEGKEKALQGELYDGVIDLINKGLPESKKFHLPHFGRYFNPENSVWEKERTVTPGKSVPVRDMVNPPLENNPDNVQIDIRLLEMLNRAEDFQQATQHLYSKNALSAEEWLPILGSLRESESLSGSYSLQFINRARPELPPQTFTTDDRRIIDFIHSYDKDLDTVSKTHAYTKGKLTLRPGIPEADAVHGLNSAFMIKTLIPWFADRNRTTVASDKVPNAMPNTLESALRVHTYVNLTQMAHGLLEDGAKLANLYRAVFSEGRGVTSSLFSSLSHVSTGVGVGLNIFSVVLDGIELAHAENESQKAVYGTQLAFDSAGLVTTGVGIGAGIFGAPIVAGFASSLAVPLAGLGIGFTALAEAFGKVASDAQAVGTYFADLDAAYQQGGYRQAEKVAKDGSRYKVMEPIPGAVIRQLDLRHGHLTFDSQYLYRNDPTYSWGSGRSNYFGWWPGRPANTDKKQAINIREGIGHKQAQVGFHPGSSDILILPVTMKSYINYEYMILPFVTARNDRGFDVLRRLEEDGRFDFDFYAFPGERVVRRIKPEFVATPVDIILDDEDRDIVIQQLPEDVHGYLSYHLTGGKGKYRISLQEGVSLSLQGNTDTHWILDARHIGSNVSPGLSKEDNRQRLHIGNIKITLSEESDNIFLINNKGISSVKQDEKNQQWQIKEIETNAERFNSLQALHDHLRQLSNYEHHNRPYLVVEHYRHSPQSRPVGRAFYETGRDRMIYTNVPDAADFLSDAELAKVEGNKAWFYRDTTLWQVDIASGEVLRQYLPIKFPGNDQEKISSHVMQGNDQLWFVVERQLDEGRISYTYQVTEETLKLVAVDGNTAMLAGLDKISEKNLVSLPVLLDSSDGEFNGLLSPLAVNQWFSGDLCVPERQVKGSPAEVISLSGRVAGVDKHYWLQTDGKQPQNVVRMNRVDPDQEDAGILAELKKKNSDLQALTADFTLVFTTTGAKPGYYFYSHQRHSLYFQQDNGLSGSPASKVAVDDIRSVSIANKQLVVLSSGGMLWLADDQGSIRLIGVTVDWLLQPHQQGLTAALRQLARDTPDQFSTLLLLGLQDRDGKPVSAWYDSKADLVVQGRVGLNTEHTLVYLGLAEAEDGRQAWIFDTDNHQLYRQPLSTETDLKLSEKRVLSGEPAAAEPWLLASHQYRSAVRQGNTLRLETPDGAVLLLSADAKMTDRPVLIAWHVQGRPDSQIASAIMALSNEVELPQAVRLFSEHGYPAWYLPEEGKTLRSSILNSNHVLHYLGQVAGQEASYVHDQTTGELWQVSQVSEGKSTLVGNYRFVNRTPESLVLQVGQVPLGGKIRLPQLAGTDRLAITGRSKESYYWLSPSEALTHYRHITIDDRGQSSAIRFSDTCIANLSIWRSNENLVLLHQASEDTSICIVSIEQAAQRDMRLEMTLKKMKIINLLRRMAKLTVLNPDVSCFGLVSEEGELRIKPAECTEMLE
ncbi:TcdA/TcdB pore-forming domain-containing protein [Xenorhabdus indica]|uniref:TcdA/TcdB pore-forming domain-containing protein n=1 Tax=Xenorhabdus indica TaxID=333964 RepID=UPI0021D4BC7A|nr:TcdA/TcdB pore-forming domain-containing protein [Xenorhabdus indica]